MMDHQANSPEGRDAVRANWAAAVPMKRLGRPDELAAAALFLASDESSFIAGIDLAVDGGATAWLRHTLALPFGEYPIHADFRAIKQQLHRSTRS
jgi:Enoyl-(Acyl carrier protein) reductase